jgi:hypothetical protein
VDGLAGVALHRTAGRGEQGRAWSEQRQLTSHSLCSSSTTLQTSSRQSKARKPSRHSVRIESSLYTADMHTQRTRYVAAGAGNCTVNAVHVNRLASTSTSTSLNLKTHPSRPTTSASRTVTVPPASRAQRAFPPLSSSRNLALPRGSRAMIMKVVKTTTVSDVPAVVSCDYGPGLVARTGWRCSELSHLSGRQERKRLECSRKRGASTSALSRVLCYSDRSTAIVCQLYHTSRVGLASTMFLHLYTADVETTYSELDSDRASTVEWSSPTTLLSNARYAIDDVYSKFG